DASPSADEAVPRREGDRGLGSKPADLNATPGMLPKANARNLKGLRGRSGALHYRSEKEEVVAARGPRLPAPAWRTGGRTPRRGRRRERGRVAPPYSPSAKEKTGRPLSVLSWGHLSPLTLANEAERAPASRRHRCGSSWLRSRPRRSRVSSFLVPSLGRAEQAGQ